MNNKNSNEPSPSKMIAGFCSFIFPGLGQLLLGRIWSACECLLFAIVIWAVSFNVINEGFNEGSNIIVFLGALLALLPNLLAAYYATHGGTIPSDHSKNNLEYSQNKDFRNYDEYLLWCRENGQEALTSDEFNAALGK